MSWFFPVELADIKEEYQLHSVKGNSENWSSRVEQNKKGFVQNVWICDSIPSRLICCANVWINVNFWWFNKDSAIIALINSCLAGKMAWGFRTECYFFLCHRWSLMGVGVWSTRSDDCLSRFRGGYVFTIRRSVHGSEKVIHAVVAQDYMVLDRYSNGKRTRADMAPRPMHGAFTTNALTWS